MHIYIDESGSINNHDTTHCPYFVIALVRVTDKKKAVRAYKRFVSSNIDRLCNLDSEKKNGAGKVTRDGGRMFNNGKFKELKGTQFDAKMKRKFLAHFANDPHFEVYFIKVTNSKLTDVFCSNTARVFNFLLKLTLGYYIKHGTLPDEECILQLDERNERTETKHFLQAYLNTELIMNDSFKGPFSAAYFDSANNRMIQIADVYANWYYSHLITGAYEKELQEQIDAGIVKGIFEFPRW